MDLYIYIYIFTPIGRFEKVLFCLFVSWTIVINCNYTESIDGFKLWSLIIFEDAACICICIGCICILDRWWLYLPISHLNTLPNFRVTRTLFVFAELTNMDPDYNGPNFNFDTIIRELVEQVSQTGALEKALKWGLCKGWTLLHKRYISTCSPYFPPPLKVTSTIYMVRSPLKLNI